MSGRSLRVFGAVAALAAAPVAIAATPGKEQIKFNAADQAAAKAAVLRRSDVGSGGGWSGGLKKKPDLSPGPTCPNYQPKQSDLVLTGAAESEFQNAEFDIDSEVQILRTARMVQLDWQRSVVVPGAIRCLRSTLAKGAGHNNAKVISFTRIPFPRLTANTAAFRVVAAFHLSGKPRVRVEIDAVLIGQRRSEIALTTIGLAADHPAVAAMSQRLARILASRVHG